MRRMRESYQQFGYMGLMERRRGKQSAHRVPMEKTEEILRLYRNLNGRHRSWMGLEKDLPPGEQLIALFRPIPRTLAGSDLPPNTIQKHADNT